MSCRRVPIRASRGHTCWPKSCVMATPLAVRPSDTWAFAPHDGATLRHPAARTLMTRARGDSGKPPAIGIEMARWAPAKANARVAARRNRTKPYRTRICGSRTLNLHLITSACEKRKAASPKRETERERVAMSDRLLRMRGNRILASLARPDLSLLERHLEPVTLKFRQRLEAAHRKIRTVYFIDSGLASVIATGGSERREAEVCVVGREGMTGVAVLLGVDSSPFEAFMQVEGTAYGIAADELRLALAASKSLASTLARYAHYFFVQTGHTALANAQGTIEKRLARWLLMAHDRIDGDRLVLTHEFLSIMLGVRRAGVTTALNQLEARALLSATRGSVTILDRDGLEEAANGLYGVPEAEFKRLFPLARSI